MKLIFLRMKINCSLGWMSFKEEREGFDGIWGVRDLVGGEEGFHLY